uniref:Uncharacterized protein n=1 Tax=Oryza meridionalis TaxID=40149 RepID=A0A0E0EFT2_9ORYZ
MPHQLTLSPLRARMLPPSPIGDAAPAPVVVPAEKRCPRRPAEKRCPLPLSPTPTVAHAEERGKLRQKREGER